MHARDSVHFRLIFLSSVTLAALGGAVLVWMAGAPRTLSELTPELTVVQRRPVPVTRATGQVITSVPRASSAGDTNKEAKPATALAVVENRDTPRPGLLLLDVPQCRSAPRVLASVVDIDHRSLLCGSAYGAGHVLRARR